MNTYIVLLKGINVGGHHKIKMADLTTHLENTTQFTLVKTYIQSGNIVLRSPLHLEAIAPLIQTCIETHYGFHIPTLVFTKENWLQLSETHPYFTQAEELKMLHVTFLFKQPDPKALEHVLQFKPDNEYCLPIDSALYLFYPDGFGRSKFNSAFIERKLKSHSTSRNWRTVQKIRSMVLD